MLHSDFQNQVWPPPLLSFVRTNDLHQIGASIFFRAPLHHRPREALHRIRRPILLTAAKGDRICPHAPVVETSRAVATAELVEVSGGGRSLIVKIEGFANGGDGRPFRYLQRER